MRHAIMIMGFGNSEVAQKIINVLDHPDIDFFIHWDKKYSVPDFTSKYSKIFYCKHRVDVKWAQYTEIEAELELLKNVYKCNQNYDYVHLISSSDIPLFTADYFVSDAYIGYQHPDLPRVDKRVTFYYPISHLNVRNKLWLVKGIKVLNYLFGVNRLRNKNIKIKMGPQWFSVKAKYVKSLLDFDSSIFKNSFLGSEEFVQMALPQFDNFTNSDVNAEALRYIKWSGNNNPHPITFTESDVDKLRNLVNTKFAFARKVQNPEIVDMIFNHR